MSPNKEGPGSLKDVTIFCTHHYHFFEEFEGM